MAAMAPRRAQVSSAFRAATFPSASKSKVKLRLLTKAKREREMCERMIKTTHLSGRGNGRARTCRHRKELLAVRCLDPHSLFLDHLLLPVD